MMKKSLLGLTVAGLLMSTAQANEEVDAASLVGHLYGGLHYSKFFADDHRKLDNGNGNAHLDDGDGFGGEIGYRFTLSNEIRIQYTDLGIETNPNLYGDVDGSSVGIDVLHFPTQKNVYLLAGLKELELVDEEVSVNVGVGYRHYFTNRFAAYVEAKGHYQFEESEKDFSTSIGLMYFFGSNDVSRKATSQPTETEQPIQNEQLAAAQKPLDSDNDGILDSHDKCPETPMSHLVDSYGCTLFSTKQETMELKINFDNNSDVIKSSYYSEVKRAADFMSRYPDVNLTIEGHTSAIGSADYNQKLSQKRADATVSLLVSEFGIDVDRLTAIGHGEEQLINTENTPDAALQNRRIQARVTASKKVPETK
jgi:OmpA-OmpF porin, OOP family